MLFSSSDHAPPCYAFASLGHIAFPIHLYHFICSNLFLEITSYPLLSSTCHSWLLHFSQVKYKTTTFFRHHPSSSRHTFSGTPLPQCSSALLLNSATKLLFHSYCTSYGLATCTTSSFSVLLNLLSLSCAFPFTGCAFCSFATCATLFFLSHNRHFLHLCLLSPHL